MTAKIKLNAESGGGSVSLKAPSTTTSNAAVELQLPVADGSADQFIKTDGSGNLSFAAAGGDKILQVVSTVKNDVFSQTLTSTNISNDVTGLTVSITPTNASNTILLMPSVSVGYNTGSTAFILLYKDGSVISNAQAPAANDGNGNALQRATFGSDYATTGIANISGNYQDTAGGTSSITYSIRLGKTRSDVNNNIYVNRVGDSDEAANYRVLARFISTFTAMEIAA